jgi:hypothetical protein
MKKLIARKLFLPLMVLGIMLTAAATSFADYSDINGNPLNCDSAGVYWVGFWCGWVSWNGNVMWTCFDAYACVDGVKSDAFPADAVLKVGPLEIDRSKRITLTRAPALR